MDPVSLAGHEALFQPSLFSDPGRCFADEGWAIANEHLAWASDLFRTGMMHQAFGWSDQLMRGKGFGGAKPWMPDLECQVRAFLSLPLVQKVVAELRPALVETKRLNPQLVLDAFNAKILPIQYVALRDYVAARPD